MLVGCSFGCHMLGFYYVYAFSCSDVVLGLCVLHVGVVLGEGGTGAGFVMGIGGGVPVTSPDVPPDMTPYMLVSEVYDT